MGRWRSVQADVVRNVRALVKLVNQTLLLQDLHNTRMCNPLLEPETSEEIWLKEDTKSRSVYGGFRVEGELGKRVQVRLGVGKIKGRYRLG